LKINLEYQSSCSINLRAVSIFVRHSRHCLCCHLGSYPFSCSCFLLHHQADMSDALHNRVAWITGAGKGIGAAIARRLAAQGVHLVLSGRNRAALEARAEELRAAPAAWSNELATKDAQHIGQSVGQSITQSVAQNITICAVECDVSSWDSVQQAYERGVKQCGAIDILINNAGVGVFAPLVEMSHEEFGRTLDTNLRGAWHCIKVALPAMLQRKTGVIVNINSIAATTTFTGATAYAASKAGLLALSRSLRQEVRSEGVKVIDVLPGATETDIWAESARAQFSERMMQADDIAEAVVAALQLNPRVMPEEITLRPQLGDL
jgi:3-oxoacyl-[acyl-carrier protein] reductase